MSLARGLVGAFALASVTWRNFDSAQHSAFFNSLGTGIVAIAIVAGLALRFARR